MKAFHTRFTVLAGLMALLAMLAPPGVARAAGPAAVEGGIRFSLVAPDAGAVFLAGDFNGWDASGLALEKGDDGVWTVVVALEPGDYEYKFVVDGQWREDPANGRKVADPFGGSNSLLTVNADGTVGGVASPPPAAPASAAVAGDVEVGPPVGTSGGVLFTHKAPGAAGVNLAGSFNGWSATDWPMTDNGSGTWSVVKPLDPGTYQYKFVVDGNWMTDPENPETQDDGYGGSNSVVTVGEDGKVVASAAAAGGASDTRRSSELNTKLYVDGRYLTRFEMAKNVTVGEGDYVATDPRWRMQRPKQSVDLNFNAEANDIATTFMRIRLDSDQNIIQNNIAGFLDEANLQLDPDNFHLKASWNQEAFTGSDLLTSGGNIDLPGTILHDHLDFGKGTGGVLFTATPFGLDFDSFFANVHNADYYNNPDLFDNTGEDRIFARLGREFGPLDVGIPFYGERSVLYLDFGEVVSQPSTGIPALDEHRARTGDTSVFYDVESHVYNAGADVRCRLGETVKVGGQFMYVTYLQRIVGGNAAGLNKVYGRIHVPFLERSRRLWMGEVDWAPSEGTALTIKQLLGDMRGAGPDQRSLVYTYKPQDEAAKRIYFDILDSPAQADLDSTDVTLDWSGENMDLTLWLRRAKEDLDYGAAGRTVPADSTLTSRTRKSWYTAGRFGMGRSSSSLGRGELEAGFTDTDFGAAGEIYRSLEFIFRYDRDLTRNTGFIADVRWITYDVAQRDADGNLVTRKPDFLAPFVGFRYTPIDQLELVLAYGVDPVEFSIDYAGRQLGRWWYRQTYLFDHVDDDFLDAEDALSKARVVTMRAQLTF